MADQVDWIVKYTDGSTFTNLEGLPHEAPRTGVQGIAVRDEETGRFTLREQDYYFWNVTALTSFRWAKGKATHDMTGYWSAGNGRDLDRYVEAPGFYKAALRGQWIARDLYRERMTELLNDPRLPPKSAWDPREVRD